MKQSELYQGVKHTEGSKDVVNDSLVNEVPLQITINGEPLSVTMQTPGDERELVRGLLYSEDIYRSKEVQPEIVVEQGVNEGAIMSRAIVTLDPKNIGKGYMNSRQLLSVASCGICGRTAFEGRKGNLSSDQTVGLHELRGLFNQLQEGQSLFSATGGCHGVAAFSSNQSLLALKEDIGRHNAVDKVIGSLLFEGNLDQAKIMCVSGRISYEIISKSFMAGIPILAAVSAPSSLAVDFAKELGIQLYAFCRENRITQYS